MIDDVNSRMCFGSFWIFLDLFVTNCCRQENCIIIICSRYVLVPVHSQYMWCATNSNQSHFLSHWLLTTALPKITNYHEAKIAIRIPWSIYLYQCTLNVTALSLIPRSIPSSSSILHCFHVNLCHRRRPCFCSCIYLKPQNQNESKIPWFISPNEIRRRTRWKSKNSWITSTKIYRW